MRDEKKLTELFPHWANHFLERLNRTGVAGLIKEYAELIQNIETESCPHGKDGGRLTGEDYRHCCGISYEYLNDISVRTALQVIFDKRPEAISKSERAFIEDIDNRLKELITRNPEVKSEEINFTGTEWWKKSLPLGVVR